MSVIFRAATLSLVLTVLAGGPLAPLARAQQPQTPAAPAPAAPAPTTPTPELFQESIKTSQAEMPPTVTSDRYSPAYDVGAGVADVFYIPGKAVLCALGFSAGIAVLVLTVGSGYRAAAAVGREGCGGKWWLTGKDLRPSELPSSSYGLDDSRR